MDKLVARVIHYYNRIGVAVLKVNAELEVGERILILGHSTDLIQPVRSMEIDHQKIHSAGPGMEVALKVEEPVRKGDLVYKVVQPDIVIH